MKACRYLTAVILMTLLAAAAAHAADSAQDTVIAVSPVVRQFPVTALTTESAPAAFTVANLSGLAINIDSVTLAGTNPGDFRIIPGGCSGSLAAAGSCTVSVSFKPTSQGTKSALLQIASSSATTPTLTAYLTNSAAAVVEASQRMPAVLAAVTIPETMTAGSNYPLSWTIEGYDDSYKSYAVMFDCTGIVDGSCGNSYGDGTRFAESAELDPTTTTAGNWSYSGVTTKKFTYNWSFTPSTRSGLAAFAADPGTEVVVRFYLKSAGGAARGSDGVSLLIPVNQPPVYYDTAGRRITKHIKAP